ncbi:dead/deah box helicase domain protein [Treponema primitia ZAS-2]|uniref:RNA helicase n=1 Tax=Treponema primitia (strain ATCC BAA-887 / DSM 12427 / ZAS-2) TaxID=545694 RepID=F5YNJ9_TREPZ|nr:DEAD/DEAH box helicase [Treponema primitia]AEF86189.1 dead/deah box helicase domain protein [Treponema primitia ZAS-2]
MTTDDTHPFSSFGLSDDILAALTRKGFTAPSSIQSIALPRLLANQGHLIVKARTGTGKTAAFGIPLVERLRQSGHAPKALILTPTRELALQVSREIASLASSPIPRITAVYGGASIRSQILDLKRGTEIVVGTPGRVMDLMERKVLDLSAIEWFILDEADEMLDMGFIEDVERILKSVKSDRRVALFSATMPDPILKIVKNHIGAVDILEDTAPDDEKPLVDQYYLVLKKEDRLEALRRLIDSAESFYGLIFCATKVGADELSRRLMEGGYSAEAIHGDLSQEARERTLRRFRTRYSANGGDVSILVATDVAARGLDIERLTHVINWDLPNDGETYVHRIGRTGRAGRRGIAITLALPSDRGRISHISRSMERTLGSKINWMKAPAVSSVTKSLENRILRGIMEALPETVADTIFEAETAEAVVSEGESGPEQAPEAQAVALPAALQAALPQTRLGRKLIKRLGAESAVEALIAMAYGEKLDPSRYGAITELSEDPKRELDFKQHPVKGKRGVPARPAGGNFSGEAFSSAGGGARVYVGLGRRNGAGARDVAELLGRAGGVPGRLVDDIEVKDYCAFATLPEDAARRACTFSRNTPGDPIIKPASGTGTTSMGKRGPPRSRR